MSGEIHARKRAGKGKSSNSSGDNAASESVKKQITPTADSIPEKSSGGAGCCTKLVFFFLLSTFALLVTIQYVDYQEGQLGEAYRGQVPKEVRSKLSSRNFSIIKRLVTSVTHFQTFILFIYLFECFSIFSHLFRMLPTKI